MKQRLQLPRNYWLGFWIMVLAYTVVQFTFYHPVVEMPQVLRGNRQLFRWVNIFFVYVVGILVIRKMQPAWLLLSWHIVHVVLIAYLGLAAVYEFLIAPMPYGIRSSAAPIIEFLISPVYYVAMGVVYAGLEQGKGGEDGGGNQKI